MKIMCWNINKRYNTEALLNIIKINPFDVICLQEIKLNSFLDMKMTNYFKHKYFNSHNPDVIVYSDICFQNLSSFSDCDNRYVLLKYKDIILCFIHNPMDEQDLLEIMVNYMRYEANVEKIGLLGDLNFFDEKIDSESNYKYCGNWFYKELIKNGYKDSFREIYGNDLQYTWYSPKKNGQRLDISLLKNIKSNNFIYYHEARELNFSDHSIMVVEIAE